VKKRQVFSHRFGREAAQAAGVLDDILDSLEAPTIRVGRNSSAGVKNHVTASLIAKGWAPKPQLFQHINIGVNAVKDQVALTIQMGNIARAFYDILKFQGLHSRDRIRAAALILPSKDAANALSRDSSNRANFDRVRRELRVYSHVITVPLLLISFE
jgi:hypothetical protein